MMISDHADKWELTMKDKMDSLTANNTYELNELPEGKKALYNKWIYRAKQEADGSQQADWLWRVFNRKKVLIILIFFLIVKLTIIRLVLCIVATKNLLLEQVDVKIDFHHCDLEEDIYIKQPQELVSQSNSEIMCKLWKSLYSLKQAPRQWYMKFDEFVHEIEFSRFHADYCCYVKRYDNSFITLLLYIDDILKAGSYAQEVTSWKAVI